MSENILLIESSALYCSVGIIDSNREGLYFQDDQKKSHAEAIAPMVQKVLDQRKIGFRQLSAVAISGGPGSYTGLRIGASFAKGLCFQLDIPFISVSSLNGLISYAEKCSKIHSAETVIACMDAKRNEVYIKVKKGKNMSSAYPYIIDKDVKDWENHPVIICGDAVEKWKALNTEHPDSIFIFREPFCEDWAEEALQKYLDGDFEDLAYYEPMYIKNFIPGRASKFLL